VLIALGAGLGFTAISPWPYAGLSTTTFTIAAGIWLIVIQWLSSAIGGFITGRLRTKWVSVHTHEVFFRDTAHGFLTWALATVVSVALVASVASSVLGTATRAAGTAASGAAQGGVAAAARAYDVDSLFRGLQPEMVASGQTSQAETTRILERGSRQGGVSDQDKTYLVDQVAARTGISHDDAQKRVDDVIAREKAAEVETRQAADTARKSASAVAFFTALSLLIGAFIASVAAAHGGSLRDEHP